MKKILIGVVILIVLVIAAAVAVPFFVPVDTYKAQLIARVKDATGRDLRIDGPVSFSLLPSLALEAKNVSFSNAPGAAAKDMAKLSQLQVKLKLLPLLRRDVEIDQLVLVDPVIALEVDKQGKPNWQFGAAAPAPTPAAPGKPAPAAPAAAGGGSGLAELRLDDVRLVNGTVSYIDQRSGEKDELGKIAMKLSLPGLDSPFTADGSAVWKNEPVTVAVSLANPRAFEGGKSSAVTLKLSAKPISFDFKGDAAGSTPVKLDGAVNLQVPSVRGLSAWLASPINMPGTGLGPLAISGKVSVAGSKFGFSEANLSLDAIKAKGEFAFDSGGARPALKGKLDVDKLDVNPYLPPETPSKPAASGGGGGGGGQGQGGGTASQSAGWSDAPIDFSPLKSVDADFALSVGSLQYRKIQVGKSALTLHLKDGRLQTDLTELALYQGAGKGKVVLDGAAAVPGVEMNFNLDKVQIGPLLKDAIDMDRLTGAGEFALAVTGRGKSQRDIIGTLNGKGDLNLTNGVIKGMNLVSMVKNITSAFDSSSAKSQETDFTSLSGTYTIANGILRNNDLALKSADIPMTGAGTVDLPKRSVDYKVTPKVAGLIAVPVVIKGPWDNLSYQPDLAGMVGDPSKLIEGGAKGVGNVVKGAPGAVDSVVKGILGR